MNKIERRLFSREWSDELQETSWFRERNRFPFLAAFGVTGCGKTTLVNGLSYLLLTERIVEEFQDNPHLEDAYNPNLKPHKREEAYLLSQKWFLEQSVAQGERIMDICETFPVVLDMPWFAHRTYTQLALNLGLISRKTYQEYMDEYASLTQGLPTPDLLIYVRPSVKEVLRRIGKRGRAMETGIDTQRTQAHFAIYDRMVERHTLPCPIIKIKGDDFFHYWTGPHMRALAVKVKSYFSGDWEPDQYLVQL